MYKDKGNRMSATGMAMTITVIIGLIFGAWGIYLTRKHN